MEELNPRLQQLVPIAPSIGGLLQCRVEEMSLRAYLCGLKSCLGEK